MENEIEERDVDLIYVVNIQGAIQPRSAHRTFEDACAAAEEFLARLKYNWHEVAPWEGIERKAWAAQASEQSGEKILRMNITALHLR